MQYRKDRKGNDISLLGFGCMRFEGSGTGEYFQKANDQVMEAIRQGINYFDTAYVYKNNERKLQLHSHILCICHIIVPRRNSLA